MMKNLFIGALIGFNIGFVSFSFGGTPMFVAVVIAYTVGYLQALFLDY